MIDIYLILFIIYSTNIAIANNVTLSSVTNSKFNSILNANNIPTRFASCSLIERIRLGKPRLITTLDRPEIPLPPEEASLQEYPDGIEVDVCRNVAYKRYWDPDIKQDSVEPNQSEVYQLQVDSDSESDAESEKKVVDNHSDQLNYNSDLFLDIYRPIQTVTTVQPGPSKIQIQSESDSESASESSPSPILLFFPSGGFITGNKRDAENIPELWHILKNLSTSSSQSAVLITIQHRKCRKNASEVWRKEWQKVGFNKVTASGTPGLDSEQNLSNSDSNCRWPPLQDAIDAVKWIVFGSQFNSKSDSDQPLKDQININMVQPQSQHQWQQQQYYYRLNLSSLTWDATTENFRSPYPNQIETIKNLYLDPSSISCIGLSAGGGLCGSLVQQQILTEDHNDSQFRSQSVFRAAVSIMGYVDYYQQARYIYNIARYRRGKIEGMEIGSDDKQVDKVQQQDNIPLWVQCQSRLLYCIATGESDMINTIGDYENRIQKTTWTNYQDADSKSFVNGVNDQTTANSSTDSIQQQFKQKHFDFQRMKIQYKYGLKQIKSDFYDKRIVNTDVLLQSNNGQQYSQELYRKVVNDSSVLRALQQKSQIQKFPVIDQNFNQIHQKYHQKQNRKQAQIPPRPRSESEIVIELTPILFINGLLDYCHPIEMSKRACRTMQRQRQRLSMGLSMGDNNNSTISNCEIIGIPYVGHGLNIAFEKHWVDMLRWIKKRL